MMPLSCHVFTVWLLRNIYPIIGNEDDYNDGELEDDHYSKNNKVVPKKVGATLTTHLRILHSYEAAFIIQEYDELSKLCDKLLDQQSRLENELKEQSAYIKVKNSLELPCGFQDDPLCMELSY